MQIVIQMKEEYDLTVISITHDIDEANLADQVLVMSDGRLITQGSTTDVFSQSTRLKKLGLDVPFFAQIKEALADRGIALSGGLDTEKELIKYLCQLNSKK
ncbi:hypothetical protein EQ500_12620 [Lactobacillus sp. XV13L]|nr:hypothetical protein [Lactobacillus sp. XV13L]